MKKLSKPQQNKVLLPLEMRLLILCAEDNPTKKQQEKVLKLMRGPVNWEVLYVMAVKNRLFPIVYKNLKKLNTGNIDAQVLEKLGADCKNNRLYALLMANELFRVMELLKKHDINTVSIKGPVLSMSLYQDISMRASRDLDILASPPDIAQIDEILSEAGFTKDDKTGRLTFKQERLLKRTFHHYSYRSSSGIQLEVHWRLSNDYYRMPFDEVWRNQKETVLFGRTLKVPDEEENLVYLILHGSRHAWKRLSWLCDINCIIRNKALDWEYVIRRARELGILHLVGQTMLLLKILFRSQLPIRPPLTKKDRRLAKRLAFLALPFLNSLDGEAELHSHPLFHAYKKYLLVRYKSIDKKVKFLISHFIPNAEDFQAVKLQDRYFFLYYLLRFLKILKRCAGICGRRLSKEPGVKPGKRIQQIHRPGERGFL